VADTGAKSRMQVLVIGSGGREHAITLKLLERSKVDAVWCYPGNAGMAQAARIPKLENPGPDALAEFAADRGIDLTVVGAEAYLAEGIVDAFRARACPLSALPSRQPGSKAAKPLPKT